MGNVLPVELDSGIISVYTFNFREILFGPVYDYVNVRAQIRSIRRYKAFVVR